MEMHIFIAWNVDVTFKICVCIINGFQLPLIHLTEFRSDRSECLKQLKHLLQQLPEENYLLLQYIISFLVKVSKYEDTNKMSSQALAIVFGPNLFR